MEPKLIVAGIDVHKKMLAVVVVDEDHPQQAREQRKFATNGSDLKHLAVWLDSQGVSLVVMESTVIDGAVLEAGMAGAGGAICAASGAGTI
jgi:hypothetical protein